MKARFSDIVLIVVMVACGHWALAVSAIPNPSVADAPKSAFSFPDDSEPVLVMTSTGTQLPITISLSLYASGTAVIQHSLRAGSTETFVGSEDREALLREVADGGLAYYDAEVVAREQKRLSGSRIVGNSPDTDLPGFSVKLRVERDRGSGLAPEMLTRTVLIYGASGLAERFPSIRAYRALANLETLFKDLLERASVAQ